MTAEQKAALEHLLTQLQPAEIHHGDCVGADAECAEIAASLTPRPKIVAHPGKNANADDHGLLASSRHNDEVLAAKTHFARNRELVDLLVNPDDLLLAAPFDRQPVEFGGTAYTITYCQKRAKKVAIVWPDGHISEDWAIPKS